MLWKRWLMIWQKTFVFKHMFLKAWYILIAMLYAQELAPRETHIGLYEGHQFKHTHKIRSTETWTTDGCNN